MALSANTHARGLGIAFWVSYGLITDELSTFFLPVFFALSS